MTTTVALTATEKKQGFQIHALVCVLTIAALAGINFWTGGYPWVLWVVLGWGIGLVSHGLALLAPRNRTLAG